MPKKLLAIAAIVLALLAIFYFTQNDSDTADNLLTAKPSQDLFVQEIFASGELKAKKSLKIRAPDGMRAADIWQTSIKDLITEGTFVNKGDYIGSLDRTELAGKLSDIGSQIETEQTKLEQTKIDTAISMKGIRDQIADVEFNITNEKLEMEKNAYEPDMVIEQSKINLKKSERSLRQLRNQQELIQIQNVAKVQEVEGVIKQLQSKMKILADLSGKFSISAPESGMLIYAKTWNGKKSVGAQISSWDPVVAELPDLSKMISIAYVNEVDISKITKGQKVEVKVDAFPDKAFTGNIIKVANIGQELKNQDAKVFEITIEIHEEDEVMKPSMSTSNQIKIYEYPDVVSVPLDAYYSDSLDYVLVKNGKDIYKQEVVSGPFSEDHIVIVSGISKDDNVLLSRVSDENIPFKSLSEEAKEEAKGIIEEWKKSKKAYDDANKEAIKELAEPANRDVASSGIIMIG